MASVKGKEFNVRIVVDESGNAYFPWVHGLYVKDKKTMEWRTVPDTVKKALEKAVKEMGV